MPNWASVIRLLRRRLVLGIIFALSLTYCAISLLAHEKFEAPYRKGGRGQGDDDMVLDNNDYAAADEGDNAEQDIFKGSRKHLAWQLELDNYDAGNSDSENTPPTADSNGTLIVTKTCRNSVQGKTLIVDERGFVCARSDLLPTGCCATALGKTDKVGEELRSGKRRRYSCETCNPQGCCAVYEYCVSCCLQSGKKRGKKEAKTGGEQDRRESHKLRREEDAIKMRMRNLDRFQICLAACRTSSASVRHENTYKDPDTKHCYSHYQRNRRDDQISNNNNEDNAAVVVTSSSTLS